MDYISILPEDLDLGAQHRYLRLPHPRTGSPQLYLPYLANGKESLLEVSRVNGSKRRTWFVGDATIDSGTMLIHHAIDPIFVVIPLILDLLSAHTSTSPPPFQPLSALISTLSSSPSFSLHQPFTKASGDTTPDGWNEDVSRVLGLKNVKRVFKLCCERKVIPAGPPSPPPESDSTSQIQPKSQAYYRPSLDAVIRLLKIKVEWFAQQDRWGCFDHNVRGLGRDGLLGRSDDDELVKAMRIKTTIDHFAQYLPANILSGVQAAYDFSALNDHLSNMSAAALAASMPPTNLPGKTDKTAAGSKRKAAPASRGVEALKKVNTTSMSKLTSFFKPKDK